MVKGAVNSTVRITTVLLRVAGRGGYIKASYSIKEVLKFIVEAYNSLSFCSVSLPQILLFSLSLVLFSLPFFLNPNFPHARRIPLPGVEGPDMDI